MRGSWADLSRSNRNHLSPRPGPQRLVSISTHRHPQNSLPIPSLMDLERDIDDESVLQSTFFARPGECKVIARSPRSPRTGKRLSKTTIPQRIIFRDTLKSESSSSTGSESSVSGTEISSKRHKNASSKSIIGSRARDSMIFSLNQTPSPDLDRSQNITPVKLLTPIISINDENDVSPILRSPIPSPSALLGPPISSRESLQIERLSVPTKIPQLKAKTRTAFVTADMLNKHSYHYYLMHNFFLSDSDYSSSNESIPEVTPTIKSVRFNLEPRFISPSPEHHHRAPTTTCSCHQKNHRRFVYIQVTGTMFQTQWTTLARHPDTLLGSDEKYDYYDDVRGIFNFTGVRQDCFESILFYYQDGILRAPKGMKEGIFLAELDFFKISPLEITIGPYELDGSELEDYETCTVPEDPNTFQAALFLLLYQKSSTKTKIYSVLDVIFILISVVSFITATIPSFRPKDDYYYQRYGCIKEFFIVDIVCMIWFFVLFVLHFYSAPQKRKFLSSFHAMIDIILIISFALLIAFGYTPLADYADDIQWFLRQTFALRVLKLSRHSLLLTSLLLALKESSRELLSVLLFVFVITFIFACFEYLVEIAEPHAKAIKMNVTTVECGGCNDDNNNNSNSTNSEDCHHSSEELIHLTVFEYLWWSIITITTIGYGTPVIHTTPGKVVGALCAITGVPLFAIPIPILSKHLERVYQRELRKDKRMKMKMSLLSQKILLSDAEIEEESDDDEDEDEEVISWQRIVGQRRKSMGPQFSMTHFNASS